MDTIQIASLILIVISFIPLGLCFIKIYLLKKYKAKATITTALVTSSEKRRGYKNSVYYLLGIQYKTIDTGIQYTGQATSLKKYAVGDEIPLMYATNDPANFKTDFGQSLKWLLPISIALIILTGYACYWLLSQEYYYSP
jgi:hypothetical protein